MELEHARLDRAARLATPGGIERGVGLGAVLEALGLARPEVRCGRFVVRTKIGEGASSTVYRAHDPELGRDVAIKVLRAVPSPGGSVHTADGTLADAASVRLRAEARALARLAHPNVVGVLAVGDDRDGTWIAMELVIGSSLARWSEATPHGPSRDRRALVILRAAAEGLAAAHEVGLVHRDFKPANVLVGDDGRVRVADFGLASPTRSEIGSNAGHVGSPDATTQRRTIVGTPRYMAPEQLLGHGADARSDQFAFAVTAWEVLTGTPPFDGRSLSELAERITTGSFTPGGAARLPRRLAAVLHRALATTPAERFTSMRALIEAWDRAVRPRAHRWPWLVAAALALVVGPLVFGDRVRCDGSAAREAFARIWNDTRRDLVATAIRGTELAWVDDAIAGVGATLDERVHAWADHEIGACASARIGDAQPLERHGVCLARALDVTDAWLGHLERPTTRSVERALASVRALPDPAACGDEVAADPEDARLRTMLAQAVAARLAGDEHDAARQASQVAELAGSRGLALLRAEALHELARARVELERIDVELEALVSEAHALATEHDAPALAFTIASTAARIDAGRSDVTAARRWLRHAEAAFGRLSDTTTKAVELELSRCGVLEAEGELARALEVCAAALADGIDPAIHRRLRSIIAGIHERRGHWELALPLWIELRDEAERELGPFHPRVGGMNLNVGTPAMRLGQLELAETSILQALEVFRVVYGDRHRWVVVALMNLGSLRTQQQDFVGAELAAEAALERCGDRRDALTARVLHNLAEARRSQGRAGEALALLERVSLIESDVLSADHPQVAKTHHTRGNALVDLGRLDEAERELRRAQQLIEHSGSERSSLDASLSRLARQRATRLDAGG